jgi:hypothetical protein
MSDADRVLTSRQRRRAPGIPIEIDAELTPPPQEPPAPSSLDGYDSIPPPIRDQLDMLASSVGDVTTALGKIWEVRKDGERLDRIDSKLGTLAEYATKHQTVLDTFVIPALKEGMRSTDEIAMQMPKLVAQLEGLALTVTNLDRHIRQLDVEVRTEREKANAALMALATRLTANEHATHDHDGRIAALERETRDRHVVTKALAKSERRRAGGIGAAVAAIVASIAAVIDRFT